MERVDTAAEAAFGGVEAFAPINRAFDATFRLGRLSVGLVVPIGAYRQGAAPDMARQVQRVQDAERLGFAAVWLRDIPFDAPSFGDVGQVYDPFVYLGLLAGATERIALGVASIVLPLRAPAHVAKAAASVDQLSGGRLLMGVASGDRPEEYPEMGVSFAQRGEAFRDAFHAIRRYGRPRAAADPSALDLVPKPVGARLPMIVTGASQQDPTWIAQNADAWFAYPRSPAEQAAIVGGWRGRLDALGEPTKPVAQPLYVDLLSDPDAPAAPIHLGLRVGVHGLREVLRALEASGVNHVALNLRFNAADTDDTLRRLADAVLPSFSTAQETT